MTEESPHSGAEVVQAAALEAIKAFRSFLDIAESVVREPGMAATVGKAFAEAASSAFRPNHPTTEPGPERPSERESEDTEADDDVPHRGVRRIHLTD